MNEQMQMSDRRTL